MQSVIVVLSIWRLRIKMDRNSLIYLVELLEGIIDGKIKVGTARFSVTVRNIDLSNTLKELKGRLKND